MTQHKPNNTMKFRILNTFSGGIISNHRSLKTAVLAESKLLRAVRRRNGGSSYLSTRIESDASGDWMPVDPSELDDARYQYAIR